jgi:hypothetical protein
MGRGGSDTSREDCSNRLGIAVKSNEILEEVRMFMRKVLEKMIKEKLGMKWNEAQSIKNEREALFSDFDKNKSRIVDLYYEIEIKKLEYLLLKREQIEESKKTTNYLEAVERVERINENCIKLFRKKLTENGYGERIRISG